jgi:hypothetical protein
MLASFNSAASLTLLISTPLIFILPERLCFKICTTKSQKTLIVAVEVIDNKIVLIVSPSKFLPLTLSK